MDYTIKPGGKDKFAVFFLTLKGPKKVITILVSIIIVTLPLIASFYDGNFNNPNLGVDVLHDYANIALYLVGLPTAIYTISRYSNNFDSAIENLKKKGVIITNEKQWHRFKIEANRIFSKNFLTKPPYLISVVIAMLLVLKYSNPFEDCWYCLENFYLAAILQIPIYLITFYIFSLTIFTILGSYLVLRRLFKRHSIEIQPLNPDNCGGLSDLASLSKILNIFILIFGLITATNIYRNYILFTDGSIESQYFYIQMLFQVLLALAYIISAFIVFFLPLMSAHKSMKASKYHELNRINKYFIYLNKQIRNDLENHQGLDQNTYMADLENTKKLYELAKKMPVYPFDLKTVSYFISSIILPVILFIIENLLNMLFGF